MAYIGQQPVVGRYILLDQISGGFNGTTSGFTMSTAGGVQGVKPGLAQNVLLSLGGVIQQPGVDYTISGSGITFTTPPVSGTTFFATVLGDAQSVGTPSDGTVTPASIASGFDFGFPNVNVTGVTTIASGVAATPSLSITGDADTGIFSPAADTLGFATAGVQRLSIETGEVVVNDGSSDVDFRVESNGNTHMLFVDGGNDRVGIGNSSPSQPLDVTGWVRTSVGLLSTHGRVNIGNSGGPEITTGALANPIKFIGGNGSSNLERMRIDSAGNVGIGESSPSAKLHVNSGTANTCATFESTDAGAAINLTDSDARSTIEQNGTTLSIIADTDASDASSDIRLKVDNSTKLIVNSSGDVGIGTTSPGYKLDVTGSIKASTQGRFGNGSAGAPSYAFDSDHDTGMYRATTNALGFATSGSERMRIDSSGRLLVGHSSSRQVGDRTHLIQIEGNSSGDGGVSMVRNVNDDNATSFTLAKTRGTSVGATTIVQNGDKIGEFAFAAADGSDVITRAALIQGQVDGTPGANDMPGRLTFWTTADGANSPTERMRIDSSGNVGIGATAPAAKLDVAGNQIFTAANPQIQFNAGGPIIRLPSANTLAFLSDSTNERMRIDSSGRVGVNCTPFAQFHVKTGTNANIIMTTMSSEAAIETFNDAGNANVPFRLRATEHKFFISGTERMRITSNGHLSVGTTTDNPGDGNTTAGTSFNANGKYFISCSADGGHINRNNDGAIMHCRRSGNLVGSITVSSSATAFNETSDYRVKENIVDITDGITRLKQLQPRRFNFIVDPESTVDGFIAHEAQAVVPQAVTGTHNEVDDDGNPVMQGIDKSKLVPLLTAALQEAIAKIETLEASNTDLLARVTALES